MKIKDYVQALADLTTTTSDDTRLSDAEITKIAFHSKEVMPGSLFVAIPGNQSDGHDYIEQAVAAGAAAVVGELPHPDSLPVPYIQVTNSRLALAKLSAMFYGYPDRRHTVIGITGTNGKTTTAYMLRHILQQADRSCSLFSTVEQQINGKVFPSNMTTQDPVTLMQWLSESRDEYVVMEVSSHGLSQHRTDGIAFDFAVFTNLSREHLDYHQTIEQYFQCKERLFGQLKPGGEAVINTHCRWGRTLSARLQSEGIPTYTYGSSPAEYIQLLHVINGVRPVFYVSEEDDIHCLELSVPGFHNVWNAMGALTAARRLKLDYSTIASALASFPGVPGRLETYTHPNGAKIVIDYAHTPDGIMQCLLALCVYKPKRIFHLFGFRGGKDDAKWEEMVKISRQYCQTTVLTLDDLNGVPMENMLDLYKSYTDDTTLMITDRTLAIQYVWDRVEPGDCIVMTGKGPELYELGFELPTRSDAETVQYLMQQRRTDPLIAHTAMIESEDWSISRPHPH